MARRSFGRRQNPGDWAGATPLRCHGNRGGRSSPVNRERLCSPCVLPASRSGRNRQGEIMSIINRPPAMVKREYELQEPIAVAVEKYATFIQSTPDHVVNSALKIVIWRDVEFRRWRKQQQIQADRKDGHAAPKAGRA